MGKKKKVKLDRLGADRTGAGSPFGEDPKFLLQGKMHRL
jgi:hypothetical protein